MLYFGLKGAYMTLMGDIGNETIIFNPGFFVGGCVGLKLTLGRLSIMPEFNLLTGISGYAKDLECSLSQGGIGFAVEF